MPALVAGIHVFRSRRRPEVVDGRGKPGHDGLGVPEPVARWATAAGLIRRIAVCPALILLAAATLLAAGAGTARAQTFQSFQATQDIAFGTVATGQTSGSVTIDAATGAATTSGGLTLFGGTILPAQFSGQGKQANKCTVTLTLPGSVTLNGGGHTATLGNLTLSPASVALQGTQNFSFKVGGKLTVPAGATAASYAGTLTVTAVFTNC